MRYPKLKELKTSREMIDVFRGYNHNLRIGDGEFYEMKNLTSADYPVLSPRRARGVYASPDEPLGLVEKDALCHVDGRYFVINGYRVNMGLSIDKEPKTLISMGAYVIIMPDKKWINTAPTGGDSAFEYGDIEAKVTTTSTVTFTLCKIDGVAYENAVPQDVAPEKPNNMDLWIDTSSKPHTLKQYAAATETWVSIATTYIKIHATGIGKPFSEGDGVTILGIESEALSDLNASMVIWAKGDDYIVVTGILDETTTQEAPVKVERRMPKMDFIIESENRLWGCRYGDDGKGNIVNEIYASKLGDFKNWNSFAGISTDSYVASLGTDGQFTGAVAHLGYPLFFKEGYMHKVYGNYPSNYQIQTTACRGVQKGCSRSLAIVNEILYYKARSAICAYDGSLPAEISQVFGEEKYSDAAAGALGNKYYISMKDDSGLWHFFVYDTVKGMWHREDSTEATCFCRCRDDLYYIDRHDKQIKAVMGSGTTDLTPIPWEATTGIIGTDSPDKKYISRIDVRMQLSIGSTMSLFAEYDSSGVWEHLFTMTGQNLSSFAVPVRAKRCDHMRLKMVGLGEAKVFSICKTIEQGSDV